ncbi:unnamed protein product [Thelazia callipaeda]|uniref:NPC1_N domain-containing protein n=1 Tax=Thelazia callipaeda TaxID=103827 RepID=A0A0N5CL64_THECL|nr:unnamed protein product [Thelazia callipaeda]
MLVRQIYAVQFALLAAYLQISCGAVSNESIGTSLSNVPPLTLRRCSMHGICGNRGGMHQTCPYNGPPLRLSNKQHQQTLASLCPHLFKGFVF